MPLQNAHLTRPMRWLSAPLGSNVKQDAFLKIERAGLEIARRYYRLLERRLIFVANPARIELHRSRLHRGRNVRGEPAQ